MSTELRSPFRIANVLLKRYGQERFDRLIAMFRGGFTNSQIAEEYQVRRQIVWRWRRELGETRPMYIVRPEVQALVGRNGNGLRAGANGGGA
jgi:hypothetical protein